MIHPDNKANMIEKYEKNRFIVRTVDFGLEPLVQSDIFAIPFAIITAWNPNNQKLSTEDNNDKNLLLNNQLETMNLFFERAVGYLDGYIEKYFCIYDLSLDKAIEIAGKYNQYSIFYNDTSTISYYEVGSKKTIIKKDVSFGKISDFRYYSFRPKGILFHYILGGLIQNARAIYDDQYRKAMLIDSYVDLSVEKKKYISLITRRHAIDNPPGFTDELFVLLEKENNNISEIEKDFSAMLIRHYPSPGEEKEKIIELLEAMKYVDIAWWKSSHEELNKLIDIHRMSGNEGALLVPKDPNDDIFNELCKLANNERWCYDIYCTTCGHMLYRYAFKEIVEGKRPSDPFWEAGRDREWRLNKKYADFRDTDLELDEQLKLAEIVSKTNINRLYKEISNSDTWLAALGLVFHKLQNNQDAIQLLTQSLTPQFLELDELSHYFIQDIFCKKYDDNGCTEYNPLSPGIMDRISRYVK